MGKCVIMFEQDKLYINKCYFSINSMKIAALLYKMLYFRIKLIKIFN